MADVLDESTVADKDHMGVGFSDLSSVLKELEDF